MCASQRKVQESITVFLNMSEEVAKPFMLDLLILNSSCFLAHNPILLSVLCKWLADVMPRDWQLFAPERGSYLPSVLCSHSH